MSPLHAAEIENPAYMGIFYGQQELNIKQSVNGIDRMRFFSAQQISFKGGEFVGEDSPRITFNFDILSPHGSGLGDGMGLIYQFAYDKNLIKNPQYVNLNVGIQAGMGYYTQLLDGQHQSMFGSVYGLHFGLLLTPTKRYLIEFSYQLNASNLEDETSSNRVAISGISGLNFGVGLRF